MGSIFKYSGLTTKIRAMRASLIKREQYEMLAEKNSVAEFVEELKKTRGYADIFNGTESVDIHRGQMEQLLVYSKYRDFEKMYRFAGVDQRKYMKLYFIKYEIEILKKIIANADNENEDALTDVEDTTGKYPDIDMKRIRQASTLEQVVEATKGSIFYNTLKVVQAFPEPTEFDYEIALDLFFFSYVWKKRKRFFKGSELESVTMNFGTEADTLNIMWIHRAKRYYDLPPAKIYAMIIPVYYRLKKHQIKRLAEAESEKEFLEALRSTAYGNKVSGQSVIKGDAGRIFQNMLSKSYKKLFKLNPYSLSAVSAYLSDKEGEIKKLVTIAECIRYKYPAEDILRQI